jgi:hypothetical protein
MPQDERENPQRRWEDVTRWDSMKDMAGVTEGFARHVDHTLGAHLVLAGPAVTGSPTNPRRPRSMAIASPAGGGSRTRFAAFGAAIERLLRDPEERIRIGETRVSARSASSSATRTSPATRTSSPNCLA